MDSQDSVRRAIKAAAMRNGGSLSALAVRLGGCIKRQNVEYWMRTGRLPEKFAAGIERESEVARWEMFPSTWHLVWPELINAEGAPAVPGQQEVRDAA